MKNLKSNRSCYLSLIDECRWTITRNDNSLLVLVIIPLLENFSVSQVYIRQTAKTIQNDMSLTKLYDVEVVRELS